MIMAESHRPTHQLLSFTAFLLLLLLLLTQAASGEREPQARGHNSEFPADSIDLTALVNTVINSRQSGSRQLFSLLSVTSYSALDLHKLTLLVYNISSLSSFSSSWSRRRFCYCVTNQTNDLTDFAAILLDVMGNSTNVHELFKSASILSVSQRNQSNCTHICVMAGRTGAEVPELWELHSITPIFNQTIVEGPWPAERATAKTNITQVPRPTRGPTPGPGPQPATLQRSTGRAATQPDTPAAPLSGLETTTQQTTAATGHQATVSAGRTTLPSMLLRKPGCPRRPSAWTGDPAAVVGVTTIGADRLQPCVLELCSFFSQCLCGRFPHKTHLKRFCVKGHIWYQKHTAEVCRRVRRVSLSRNLKQRCLTKMCKNL